MFKSMYVHSNTTDAMIYSALARVGLQGSFFESLDSVKTNTDYDVMRTEFVIARRDVLSRFIGSWSYKTKKLYQNSNLADGWHYAPGDYIQWGVTKPALTDTDDNGIAIYYFGAQTLDVQYIYDRDDMSMCPPEIIEYTKWHFLWNIATYPSMGVDKTALIAERWVASGDGAAKRCALDKTSNQKRGWHI